MSAETMDRKGLTQLLVDSAVDVFDKMVQLPTKKEGTADKNIIHDPVQ